MYDLVLSGGLIVDGTGSAPYTGCVCVKDGRIAHISAEPEQGRQNLDVSGRVVSPGFIDIHSHSDSAPLVGYLAESKLAQGITTEIVGNCGESCIPATPDRIEEVHQFLATALQMPLWGAKTGRLSVSDYKKDAEAAGIFNNFGNLVGHSTLRLAVMGFVDRRPSPAELEQLKELLERELERGAFGMSLGLIYPPSAFSAKEELLELAVVLKKYNATLAVHMRSEGAKVFEAVDEVLEIARLSGVHLEISHLKLMGKPQWGRSGELLAKIDAARTQGINVTCDQYPFTASSTSLTAVLPHWAQDGGTAALLERLQAPSPQLRREMMEKIEERGGACAILITSTNGACPQYEGQYLSELSSQLHLEPTDTAIRLLLDAKAYVKCVYFCMDERDVRQIMQQPYVCVGSDGYAFSYDSKYTPVNPHPRNFGTYPQFFQTVRECRLMPLETAVRKATALPAEFIGIHDRGFIKEGYMADLTVFDPEHIANRSTYVNPKLRPEGIDYVFVNGEIVMDHNVLTANRPGRVLLHGK